MKRDATHLWELLAQYIDELGWVVTSLINRVWYLVPLNCSGSVGQQSECDEQSRLRVAISSLMWKTSKR